MFQAPASAVQPHKKKTFQTPTTAAPGGKHYGKTKASSYISEAEAKAGGNHAVSKKGCA